MRSTEKNIKKVIERTYNGITYGFHVVMKSGFVSDSRDFAVYENGKTVIKELSAADLPASVRAFMKNHPAEAVNGYGDDYTNYIYQ